MANKRSVLLKLSDDVKKKISVHLKVRKDEKQLESMLIDYEAEVAELQEKLEELKGAESLNPDLIIDTTDDLLLAKRRLQMGNELKKELFEVPFDISEED